MERFNFGVALLGMQTQVRWRCYRGSPRLGNTRRYRVATFHMRDTGESTCSDLLARRPCPVGLGIRLDCWQRPRTQAVLPLLGNYQWSDEIRAVSVSGI